MAAGAAVVAVATGAGAVGWAGAAATGAAGAEAAGVFLAVRAGLSSSSSLFARPGADTEMHDSDMQLFGTWTRTFWPSTLNENELPCAKAEVPSRMTAAVARTNFFIEAPRSVAGEERN